jgi:type I restriction enzyme S subunit
MNHKIGIPQLRFKEFDGEWELNKLGEMAQFKAGYAFKSQQMLAKKSNYQLLKMSNVYQNELRLDRNPSFWKTIDAKQKEFLLKKGDSILTLTGTIGKKDYGYSIKIEDDNKFLLNQRLVLLREIQNKSDNGFISYLISNEKFLFYFFAEAKGGTGNQTNVSTEDVKNIKLNFPTLPEQQKIASFLSAVDEKIQQLSRKKELLEQYKKGVMQQLFSGKLRFKDENGNDYADWEEKRLDSMISKFVVPMRDKPKELKGEIPWCRIEDFDGKYLSKSKSGQGVSIKTVKEMNLKVYPIGTLLVSCSANLGFCAITETELITNQTFIGLVPNSKKVDVLYLLYVMRMLSHKLNTLSSGTTISYLSRQQFEQFKVPYPNLLEQQKIANFLSSIDDKIESVNQQITQTQSFKKGLLQQLFV